MNTDNKKHKRPFIVTLLAILVLSITTLHLVRTIEAIRQWDFLSGLPVVSPLYMVATGLVGAIVGLVVSWGLWRGLPWAPDATRIAWTVYWLYQWFERFFLYKSDSRFRDWQFVLGLSIISLLFVFGTLSLAGTKDYFGETHD